MDLIVRFVYPHEEDTIGTDMRQYWSNLVSWWGRWSVHLVYGTFCIALLSGVIWQRIQVEQYRALLKEATDMLVFAILRGCFD